MPKNTKKFKLGRWALLALVIILLYSAFATKISNVDEKVIVTK